MHIIHHLCCVDQNIAVQKCQICYEKFTLISHNIRPLKGKVNNKDYILYLTASEQLVLNIYVLEAEN